MAEAFFVLAAFALPILAGAAARLLGKPSWWGAVVAIVVMLVAAIAPEPEEGESRLVAGDLVFLLIVAGLAWVGARVAGRSCGPPRGRCRLA